MAPAEAPKPGEGEQPAAEAPKPPEPEAPKPGEQPPAPAAVTPQALDEVFQKHPELKAALDAAPEAKEALMATARAAEAAKPVLELIPTVEDARFVTENANQFLGLQHKFAMAAEMPEMGEEAFRDFVGLFHIVDEKGNPLVDPVTKAPVLTESFHFLTKKINDGAMTSAVEDYKKQADQVAARYGLTANLTAEEKAAKLAALTPQDRAAIEEAEYAHAALSYAAALLKKDPNALELPELPADATPEQRALQEKLAKELEQVNAGKLGQKTAERIAARRAFEREMNIEYGRGVGEYCQNEVKARKERGEYIPDMILNQKWINPATQQATDFPDFPMRMAFALTAKIRSVPTLNREWQRLEALGQQAKEARQRFVAEQRARWLPGLVNEYLTQVQAGVRQMAKQGEQRQERIAEVARTEPQTAGSAPRQVQMNAQQISEKALQLLANDPEYRNATRADQAEMHMMKMEEIRAGKA